MNNTNNVIYRIKNIAFFFFIAGYIKLIPNIFNQGIAGIIFLWLGIIYTLLMFVCYVKKNKDLNNNTFHNILSILLYLYIFFVASKYNQMIINNYTIDSLYFKINYLIASIAILGVGINSIILLQKDIK